MGGGAQKWEYFAGGGIQLRWRDVRGSLQQTLLRVSSPRGVSKPAGSCLVRNVRGDGGREQRDLVGD